MAREIWWNKVFRIVVFSIVAGFGCFCSRAQTTAVCSAVIDLPRGPVTYISSRDHRWTLIFECPDYRCERKLWIEDNRTHTRRFIRIFERSLDISWAPDSRLFFVEDAYASNETLRYVFDPVTLKVTDLAELLRGADPESDKYIQVGHSYLKAERWLNSHELLVSLDGYCDEPTPRG